MFAAIERVHGGLDFLVHGVAFADRDDLARPFVETSREGFRQGAGRERLLAGGAVAPRGAADGRARRRQHPDADLPRQRARVHELQRDGRRQGRARSDRSATSRRISGPKDIRVNAISAGPIKTLAAAGISGFSAILQTYRDRAPLRRTIEGGDVADAALFLLGQPAAASPPKC